MPRNIVDKKPIRIARGATLRPLAFQFTDPAGEPIDCTGNTVTFSLVAHAAPGTLVLDAAAAIAVAAATGRYDYQFSGTIDTWPAAGLYRGWFERSTGGEREPLPGNGDYLLIEIYDRQETAQ
jgi:hypothetical protein